MIDIQAHDKSNRFHHRRQPGHRTGVCIWLCRKREREWRWLPETQHCWKSWPPRFARRAARHLRWTIDMASAESIHEAFATTAKEFGPVAILVNNAGITKDGLALRMKKDDWDSVLATNLTGFVSRSRNKCCKHMMTRALGAHHQHLFGGRRDG